MTMCRSNSFENLSGTSSSIYESSYVMGENLRNFNNEAMNKECASAATTSNTDPLPLKRMILNPSENDDHTESNIPKPPAMVQRVRSSTDKTKKPLPLDFEPTEYSVICGNKRSFYNSTGNRRFRLICQMHLEEFVEAQDNKQSKSIVVSKVMKMLRDACPVGAFVAYEKGRWWEVSDRTSREKVGTFFRDCLGDAYKSSSKNKVANRKMKRFTASPTSSPVPSSNTTTAKQVIMASRLFPPAAATTTNTSPSNTAPSSSVSSIPLLPPLTMSDITPLPISPSPILQDTTMDCGSRKMMVEKSSSLPLQSSTTTAYASFSDADADLIIQLFSSSN